jgi:hypothetical protein
MKHRSCASDQKALSEELAALSGDTVKSLKDRWRALWNSETAKTHKSRVTDTRDRLSTAGAYLRRS